MKNALKFHCVIGILLTALAICGLAQLSAQSEGCCNQRVLLIPDGKMIYDVAKTRPTIERSPEGGGQAQATRASRFGLNIRM
jgi:hypothetical protein